MYTPYLPTICTALDAQYNRSLAVDALPIGPVARVDRDILASLFACAHTLDTQEWRLINALGGLAAVEFERAIDHKQASYCYSALRNEIVDPFAEETSKRVLLQY